jgi:hypothetical protein
MNSIPFYRDFSVAGELTQRPRGEPAPARRGLLERDIARFLGGRLGPDGRLTDEIERRLFEHLNGNRGFRP